MKYFDINDIYSHYKSNVEHIHREHNKHLGGEYKLNMWEDWNKNIDLMDKYYELLEKSGGNKILSHKYLMDNNNLRPNTTLDGHFYEYVEKQWAIRHGLDKYDNLTQYYKDNYRTFRNQTNAVFNKPEHKPVPPSYQEYINEAWSQHSERQHKRLSSVSRKYKYDADVPNLFFDFKGNETKAVADFLRVDKNYKVFTFTFGDMLFINGHGSKNSGDINYTTKFGHGHNAKYKPQELIGILERSGEIPEHIKEIYTINCYGGLQTDSITESGIPIRSSHSSVNPVLGITAHQSEDVRILAYSFILKDGDINEHLKEGILRNIGEETKIHKTIDEFDILFDTNIVKRAVEEATKNNLESTVGKKKRKLKIKQWPKSSPSVIDDTNNNFDEIKPRKYNIQRGPKGTIKHSDDAPVDIEIPQEFENIKPEKPSNPKHDSKPPNWRYADNKSSSDDFKHDWRKWEKEKNKLDSKKALNNFKNKKKLSSASSNAIKTGIKPKGKGLIVAAALVAGGMVLHGLSDDDKSKKSKKQKYNHYQSDTYQEQRLGGNEQQIAADISSYRYGKRMTGFVN